MGPSRKLRNELAWPTLQVGICDIIDDIGGWLTQVVWHSYGIGYPVAVIQRWLEQLE